MSDPNETGAGISVTIKQDEPGGKYNDPKSPGAWLVFHGSPARVREQIIETFELHDFEGKLYELVQEAQALFKATGNVSQGLGGKPVSETAPSNVVPFRKKDTSGESADDVFKKAEQGEVEPAAPAVDPILEAIEASTSVAEITRVRAENKDAITPDSDYWAPYVAKGKALKAAESDGGGAA